MDLYKDLEDIIVHEFKIMSIPVNYTKIHEL